jgi:hypothetical protein
MLHGTAQLLSHPRLPDSRAGPSPTTHALTRCGARAGEPRELGGSLTAARLLHGDQQVHKGLAAVFSYR